MRNEIAQIDRRMEALSAEKLATETALASPGMAPAEIADHGRRLNHVAAELAMLEERWLDLHQQIESLQAAAT
jgi:ATP-binding cassette subfamily F protein 3